MVPRVVCGEVMPEILWGKIDGETLQSPNEADLSGANTSDIGHDAPLAKTVKRDAKQ